MLHLIRTAWAEPSLCRTITQATRPSKPGLLGGNPAASAITPPDECCIRRHSARFQRGQRLAQHVLGALVAAGALGLLQDHRGDRLPAQLARCREAMLAGDQREPLALQGADRDRDDQAAHGHRAGQRADVLGVELAHVAADLDPVDRDLLRATRHGGSGHVGPPLRLVASPVSLRSRRSAGAPPGGAGAA
jgi:hypothetical protein